MNIHKWKELSLYELAKISGEYLHELLEFKEKNPKADIKKGLERHDKLTLFESVFLHTVTKQEMEIKILQLDNKILLNERNACIKKLDDYKKELDKLKLVLENT